MYDKYMIVVEEFRSVESDGKVTGFQFGLRLPYYRGVVLSLVGETLLTVDGEQVPEDRIAVTVGGKTLPKTALEDEPAARWEFGEVGVITVEKPGGLAPGEHDIEVAQHLKISYVPVGFWGKDRKTLDLAG